MSAVAETRLSKRQWWQRLMNRRDRRSPEARRGRRRTTLVSQIVEQPAARITPFEAVGPLSPEDIEAVMDQIQRRLRERHHLRQRRETLQQLAELTRDEEDRQG